MRPEEFPWYLTASGLREFCVIEFCIVMHCGANLATGAPQTFFYNNKLQFSDPTTNRAVGSSNLSGRAKNEKAPSRGLF